MPDELTVTRKGALDDLAGATCLCGEKKTRGQTFCKVCYYSLTRAQQRGTWKDIYNGYLDAVKEAALALIEKGRFTLLHAQERLGS